ncbi:GTPase Era [Fructobacillus pseudoficulneus]|uniref:GTPase Era n=1 Tax=Fructobacillus pseudoficulneus TaxID=220714 RepID=A0A3F3H529_9LACO|nr:GTPase Era [Fructobacillus pseudoficulneus]GAP02149.1 GTPase Era [Fructobacillus pseudoficulneus]SEH35899.1 GTP-binding protein Era [Fructobacillus pseudoficulneus]
MTNPGFKSGFVAIIGRPNVGKSTLLNRIVGEKIAIMSNKAQTTRNKIQGIYTTNEAQVVFIDTPGVHKPQNSLGDYMVKSAFSALHEADAIWFVADASQKRGGGDNYIIDRLKEVKKTPLYLLINKVDLLDKEELFSVIQSYQEDAPEWKEIFPISAREGDNVPELLETVIGDLDEGPQYFDSDQLTDHPERFVISELIREKVLQLTKQEVPHSVAVVIDKISADPDGLVSIQASIIVERASQKNIVIGKQGRMIKEIGTRARKDIERLLGSKVFLETWVKVEERWRDRPQALQSFGYRKDDF